VSLVDKGCFRVINRAPVKPVRDVVDLPLFRVRASPDFGEGFYVLV
jgi:hypothetical protein